MQGEVNFTPLFWSISQPNKLLEQFLPAQLVPAASRLLPWLCPLRCCTVQSVPRSGKLDHGPSGLVQRRCVCKVSDTSWVLCRKLISCFEQAVSCGSLGRIWLDGCGPPWEGGGGQAWLVTRQKHSFKKRVSFLPLRTCSKVSG